MQQEMEYIYQVYLEGSISRAAEKLYMTQPALSIAVQRVEHELGMPIFDRTTRPLTLTQAGEIYIETIHKTRYLEQELTQQIADIRELNSGSITIGGSHYLNAYILPEILSGFSRQYPKISIELAEHSSAHLAQMLSRRELDLTFNCDPAFMMDFERYPAFFDRILLAVPESDPINHTLSYAALNSGEIAEGRHLENECPSVPLEYFKELDFLLLAPGNNLYTRSLQLFQNAKFEPKIKMEIAQLATAFHLASHGFAAAFVSDRLVVHTQTHLCYYKLDSELTCRPFFILLPRKKYIPFAVKAFIRYFTENMRENDIWKN